MKVLKKFLFNCLAAINVASILLMLISGYSDHIVPGEHEWLACAGMALPIVAAVNLLFIPLWVFLSWKRLWIPVVGYALAYVPIRIYMPLHIESDPPEDALTLISWNVCGFGGNYKYEDALDRVGDYAKQHHADILCLQEDHNEKQAMEKLAEVFPYNDTTKVSNPSLKTINCVGIHTRFPILRKEVIDYGSKTNGSVAYYLQVGSDTVIVINNHLESTHLTTKERDRYKEMLKGGMSSDNAQDETKLLIDILGKSMVKRASQARMVHEYVEQHRQYPVIVCGDFNDTPISYTRRIMAEGLTDCYVETGRGIGVSYNKKGFNFRIDHVLASDHFTPYGCKIDSKNDVSDHYPVLCWLKIADKP